MHVRLLLLLALIVACSANNGDGRGNTGDNFNSGGLESLRENKIADMMAATSKAIGRAAERANVKNSHAFTDKAFMLAVAGTDKSVTVAGQTALEKSGGERRLAAVEYDGTDRDDTGVAGALEAQRAIFKASISQSRGAAKAASKVGSSMAFAMTTPGSKFAVDHVANEAEGLRKLMGHRKVLT